MKTRRKAAGVTLLELTLVIALIGILGSAAVPAVVASFKAQAKTKDNGVMLDKMRYALERLAFEIREVGVGTITTMTSTRLIFSRVEYVPLTANTYTQATRAVTIDLTPPQLVTAANGTSVNQCNGKLNLSYATLTMSPAGYVPVLTDGVCELKFDYYDQANAVATTAATVRYVQISLTLAPTTGGTQFKQYTRIALRNR
jgi:type II secretory pathway pseudopilin PulG